MIQAVRAYTRGQLFHLSLEYPAMTIGHDRVEGFLLTFVDESVLPRLDELEGYSPTHPHENEYERDKIPVYSLSDQLLGEAWAYLMAEEKIAYYNGTLVASGWWDGD